MRKPLIATTLLLSGVLGTGYLMGQLGGATATFAAAKKHAAGTTKHKLLTGSATQRQTAGVAGAKHADGQITAVNGSTLTIKADADKAGSNEYTAVTTVNLSGSTKYQSGKGSAATSTKPTIAVGQYIVAEGTVSSDGKTLDATLVSVGTHGQGRGGPGGPAHASGPHADGTVTAVNGSSITIKADADQAGSGEYTAVTTITLSSATQYETGRGGAASTVKPAITAGEYIMAEGTLSNGGTTLNATRVSVRPTGPGGH
jgi:Domain of unknown function (DUF5666)